MKNYILGEKEMKEDLGVKLETRKLLGSEMLESNLGSSSKREGKDNRIQNKVGDVLSILTGVGLCIYIVLTAKWMLGFGGDNALAYTACSLVSKAIYNHELPLWNPYICGGLSNIGSPVSQAFYPINWLLSLIFYNADTQMLSYAILPANRIIHLSIYFCGMYLLLRHLKLSSASAFLIGILSTFCCTLMCFMGWVMYFDGCCWFPFLILASIKMFETHGKKSLRYVGVLGMLWAFVALLSFSHALVMEVFFCTILLVIYMCRRGCHERWFLMLKFVGAGIIGVFLSMPVFLSTIVFMKNCARYLPDVGWIYQINSIPFEEFALKHILTIQDVRRLLEVVPTRSWFSISGLSIFLIILGVVSKKKLCAPLFLCSAIGAVFTFFYSIGLIVPDVVYYVPFLNNNRENFMYIPFFGFFLSIFAAEGICCIEKIMKEKVSFDGQIRYPKMIIFLLGGL